MFRLYKLAMNFKIKIKIFHLNKRSNKIFESVKNEYENHIPIYVNRIQFLQQKIASSKNEVEKLGLHEEIIELSRLSIDKIDQTDLLRYIGEKCHDSISDEMKK